MSYASQQFLIFDNSSNANFRSWGSAISAAIAAMGWVQTADPQANWTTVVAPISNTFGVNEFWRMADALQTGATQIFLKVEYGSSNGSPLAPTLRMTLATGTDGSGNLTGFTTSSVIGNPTTGASGNGSTTYDCYFSGDTNRMSMMLWRGKSNTQLPYCFVIERTHNTDGTDSSDGVTIATLGGNSGATGAMQTVVFGVGAANVSAARTYLALSNGVNASDIFNNSIPVSPTFPDYGKIGNPMIGLVWLHSQEIAESAFFQTSVYGATRTYIASGLISAAAPASMKAAFRFD